MTFVDLGNTFTVNLVFIFRLLQYKVVVNRHIQWKNERYAWIDCKQA